MMETTKRVMTTREASEYTGIDYDYFRKARNRGYFGRDRYPAPKFFNFGDDQRTMRYLKEDLDIWLENYPRYNVPAEYFKKPATDGMAIGM